MAFSHERIEDARSKYGAPMGRHGYDETGGEPTQCRLSRLRFVDYDYDQGGAYWGGPADVYWLRDYDGKLQDWYRAKSRHEAMEMAQEQYPHVMFYQTKRPT